MPEQGFNFPDLWDYAKAQIIDSVYSIITPSNVRLFLIFDQTGQAVSTITDRSTIGGIAAHVTTLRDGSLNPINASTCTPNVAGLCPSLKFDTTHIWNTPDANDLSFGNGSNDSAFSIVALIKPTDMTSAYDIVGKYSNVTGATQKEYLFLLITGKLYFICYDDSVPASIGRLYNTALTDTATWVTYAATKSIGVTSAAIKLYRNGAQIDDTNSQSGGYVAMENKSALVGDYDLSNLGAIADKGLYAAGVILVVAEELTSTQLRRLDAVLRGYAGVSI